MVIPAEGLFLLVVQGGEGGVQLLVLPSPETQQKVRCSLGLPRGVLLSPGEWEGPTMPCACPPGEGHCLSAQWGVFTLCSTQTSLPRAIARVG